MNSNDVANSLRYWQVLEFVGKHDKSAKVNDTSFLIKWTACINNLQRANIFI